MIGLHQKDSTEHECWNKSAPIIFSHMEKKSNESKCAVEHCAFLLSLGGHFLSDDWLSDTEEEAGRADM